MRSITTLPRLMQRLRAFFGASRRRPLLPMSPGLPDSVRPPTSVGGRWLLPLQFSGVLSTLSVLVPLSCGLEPWAGLEAHTRVCALISILLFPAAIHGTWRLIRTRHGGLIEVSHTSGLTELKTAEAPRATKHGDQDVAARVESLFATRPLITVFQPICHLGTGKIVGAEALTRFMDPPFRPPDQWFADAESIGRGLELEFLALETALAAAARLPAHVYAAFNLSPSACLDLRLSGIVRKSGLRPERIVVELTERSPVADYARLTAALAPLRSAGVRLAIDDVGAGFSSMRHILRLRPELIKLDRTIVAGIDDNPGQKALFAAMLSFASHIGAGLVAEGIETSSELATLAELGVSIGQGYLLGRPSVLPGDWPLSWWREQSPESGNDDGHDA